MTFQERCPDQAGDVYRDWLFRQVEYLKKEGVDLPLTHVLSNLVDPVGVGTEHMGIYSAALRRQKKVPSMSPKEIVFQAEFKPASQSK
jgi:hypothetical protein